MTNYVLDACQSNDVSTEVIGCTPNLENAMRAGVLYLLGCQSTDMGEERLATVRIWKAEHSEETVLLGSIYIQQDRRLILKGFVLLETERT